MKDRKRVLLTGATGRIGGRIAARLIADGHDIIAVSRRSESLAEFKARFAAGPGAVETVVGDLSGDGASKLADEIGKRGLLPHAIVHAAIEGSNQRLDQSGKPSSDQWRAEFDLSVVAPYQLTTAIAEFKSSVLQSVVNISSMYGVVARNPALYDDLAYRSPVHYGVAKAALIHLTKEMAVQLAPRGIRVNAVSFGGMEGSRDKVFYERYGRFTPSGRMLKAEEIPGVIAFLISDDAAGINGHNLVVDGGWTIW